MSRRVLLELIGLIPYPIRNMEVLISALGGCAGILGIYLVSDALFGHEVAVTLVPSMGASAVLLFAAPHAPFSQPWNVFAGHLLSAVIGVACWRWIPQLAVAAAFSVGLAIAAMYIARCIHPPGGATALAAVIGPASLHELGFAYIFQPVLLNVAVIMTIAIVFNCLFHWRRYPAGLQPKKESAELKTDEYPPINHEDFVYALSQIDTIVDATEDDLLKIYQLATKRHQQSSTSTDGTWPGENHPITDNRP